MTPEAATDPRTPSGTAPRSRGESFRPELHGLRGLAVLLVVVYHVFTDRVSGGVDVFLLISAYFLTGSFVRRMEAGRPIAPVAYWSTVFKRLLPPAALVVLATLGAVRIWLPPSTWLPAMHDAIGTMLQVENWVLIARGTDYGAAATVQTSPLQHFWSLSIQGQVFLLWPLLFALCALLVRRTGRSPRAVVAAVVGVIAVASLARSVQLTAVAQPVAYFDTTTRLWEFAAGTLLAVLPALALPRAVRWAAGWAGVVLLVGTGLVIDAQSQFPGWLAAVPLLGAVGVVLGGETGSAVGADRLLRWRPVTLLGDLSYALYLVHWPLLTVVVAVRGDARPGLLVGAVLVLVSLLLAAALTRCVDTPVRRSAWLGESALRRAGAITAVLVLVLVPTLTARAQVLHAQEEAEARAVADNPGARVLAEDYTPHPAADPRAAPLPSAATLRQDWATLPEDCDGELAPRDEDVAEAIGEDGCMAAPAGEGAKVMVAVGNSRLAQSAMALTGPAARHGWTLVVLHRNSCEFTPEAPSYTGAECDAFNDAALEYIEQLEPDAVMLHSTLLPKKGGERPGRVLEETVPALLSQDVPVVALRDEPRRRTDPVQCLEDGGTAEDCTETIPATVMPEERADADELAALRRSGELHAVDLLGTTCPGRRCPPLIGNTYVMFDRDHVTSAYATSQGDALEGQLEASGFRW